MKHSHTSGQWQAFRAFANNAPDYWLVSNRAFKGETIAECTSEANAKLIAQSPAMLETLQRVQSWLYCDLLHPDRPLDRESASKAYNEIKQLLEGIKP